MYGLIFRVEELRVQGLGFGVGKVEKKREKRRV